MKSSGKINRRKFIGTSAATAAAFTIVPRHVIAGSGKVAPSDKINIANIGCGTQGLREMRDMLQNDEVQVTSICDVNKFSTDYLDWSAHGIRNNIRETLGDPTWGEGVTGISGGRDVTEDYINKFYGKKYGANDYQAVSSYEDYRELLEKENDIDAVKIMTPDHTHAAIAIAAMKKGKHIVTHKPIANRMKESRITVQTARDTGVVTHLLAWSPKPEHDLILSWIKDGVIGELKEIHNWSFRPVWPQWTMNPTEEVPVPKGFNWDLWLGPVPDRAYHPNYTHNVFRGWYDFGGGSIADMGHYSLFPLFQALGVKNPPIAAKAYGTTTRTVIDNVCRWVDNDVAFPQSSTIRIEFPAQPDLPAFDLVWYDGGIKPFAPEELRIDGEDIGNEGMMFVGDKGKIIAGFLGQEPRIIPKKEMDNYAGNKSVEPVNERRSDRWAAAIKSGKESVGSFQEAEIVSEAINLAAIALRAGERVEFDSKNMQITNNEKANEYLTREYRPGWEI